MDVNSQETDWRSATFRQKLVSQIDEAMRKAGVAHNKSSKDMEGHVFQKAKTREEYLSLVARLIIHFRDIHNKKSQASVGDPMNALQNLTGVAPAGAPGMGINVRPPGAPMGGMAGLGQMTQQMNLPGQQQQQQQQQQPGTSVMAPHNMAGVAAPANDRADGPDTDEEEVVTMMLHNIATSSQTGRSGSAAPPQPLPQKDKKSRKERRVQMPSTSNLSEGVIPTVEQFRGLERAILRVQQKRLRAMHMLGRRIGTMDSNVTAALGSVKGSIDELCQAVRSVTQAVHALADNGHAKNQSEEASKQDHRPSHYEGRLATVGSARSPHTTSVQVNMLLSRADVSSGLMQARTALEELKAADVGITAVEPQEIESDLSSQSSPPLSVVETESRRPTCIVNGYGNDKKEPTRGKRKQSGS